MRASNEEGSSILEIKNESKPTGSGKGKPRGGTNQG